jgi:serine/threonine protein kinase
MEPKPDRDSLRKWDPERIGSFVVLGRLGAGAMGQVYLGRSASGRLVAIKTIKPELAEETGFRTRFAQEVAAARKVSGVFTAAVVDADPDADLPWLATAYVPAPSLQALARACGPLPVTAVRWLAAGCAEALESIHAAGLVHRDLKPSNVLVAPDGPRVIDFGVARAAERMELSTARGAVGTPAYMAPEQARDTRQASVASDVYSLGATLVFAATGHAPYAGDTVMDVLARLATEEPDLSGLPAELIGLVVGCLQRVPRDRPTSSALLARLGPFSQAQAGPDEAHAYLPEAAMALIGEYQRGPQGLPSVPVGEDSSGDPTAASYSQLPASAVPPRRPTSSQPPGFRPMRWLRTRLAWAGWAAGGAALVVGGVVLGATLTSNGSSSPAVSSAGAPPAGGPPVAPDTGCSSVSVKAGPGLCMSRASGSPTSSFVVHGRGFRPGASLTVTVIEVSPQNRQILDRATAVRVAADGDFSLPVSRIDPGKLALGQFTITVTGAGAQAMTQFIVVPPGSPPTS